MKKIVGIIYNPEKKRACKDAKELQGFLRRKKCDAELIPSNAKKISNFDFAVTLGGDGTMLKASRLVAPLGIPVLGINMGSLGFLAETTSSESKAVLADIIRDKFHIEERMMLDVMIKSRNKKIQELALNDCIIHSGMNGRVITIRASINDEFLADYISDGLIISTPTGSTAYSLAASGPIVHPSLSLFVLTPICPHTLTQRPLIVSTNHILSFTVDIRKRQEIPVVSVDGQLNYALKSGDQIVVTASPRPLQLIVNPKRKYFQVLRAKLKWGERG
ncbi:MAG: NAD(+)/NADH kinase [Elusimicrobiota bacterium]